jgi:hypothetical protein
MFQTWVDNIVAFQVFLAPIDIVADDQEDWLDVFESKSLDIKYVLPLHKKDARNMEIKGGTRV